MRILTIAIFLLCINIAVNITASTTMLQSVAPKKMIQLGEKLPNATTVEQTAPRTLDPVLTLVGTVLFSGLQFIYMVIEAPSAFAFLVAEMIGCEGILSCPYAVQTELVGGLLVMMWSIYLLGLIEFVRGFRIQ